jgi:hypothetical protein
MTDMEHFDAVDGDVSVDAEAPESDQADVSDVADHLDHLDDDDADDVMLLAEVDTALELPMWQATGEARVDAALDLLGTLDGDDVHQHAGVFTQIHEQLRGTLVDLDSTS